MEVTSVLRAVLPERTAKFLESQYQDPRIESVWEQGERIMGGKLRASDGMNVLLSESADINHVVKESMEALRNPSGIVEAVLNVALKLEVDFGVVLDSDDISASVGVTSSELAEFANNMIAVRVSFYNSSD